MTKSMQVLTRGKDHGEGQPSQKKPHCVSADGSWGMVRDKGVEVMCTLYISPIWNSPGTCRGQCVSGI